MTGQVIIAYAPKEMEDIPDLAQVDVSRQSTSDGRGSMIYYNAITRFRVVKGNPMKVGTSAVEEIQEREPVPMEVYAAAVPDEPQMDMAGIVREAINETLDESGQRKGGYNNSEVTKRRLQASWKEVCKHQHKRTDLTQQMVDENRDEAKGAVRSQVRTLESKMQVINERKAELRSRMQCATPSPTREELPRMEVSSSPERDSGSASTRPFDFNMFNPFAPPRETAPQALEPLQEPQQLQCTITTSTRTTTASRGTIITTTRTTRSDQRQSQGGPRS